MDIEKLYERFNKKWIGALYGYSIFFIFCSFGAIIGFALSRAGENYIYLFLLLLVIGYAIALPIGYIRAYLRKNYKEGVN